SGVVLLAVAAFILFPGTGPWHIIVAGGIILQLLVFTGVRMRLQPLFKSVQQLRNVAAGLSEVCDLMAQEEWSDSYLLKLHNTLKVAQNGMHSLRRLSIPVALRNHGILGFVLNGLVLWDVHTANYVAKHIAMVEPSFDEGFAAVARLEALVSLTTPCFTRSVVCWPDLSTEPEPHIRGKDVQHLLIPEPHAVGNDITLSTGVDVITGSNMSGKTTLLRTVGTNLVLAYAGAPLPARSFHTTKMHIFTSMRVGNSIGRGESTFYAELKRIRGMIEFSRLDQPFIALIDEIFKGTNSADRIVGAKATLRHLADSRGIVMVSTHDFELCDLATDPAVAATNHHFVESYPDGRLYFDYKMRPGRCQTTNARYLLRMAGILDEEGKDEKS
ncbi:MAG TPA: DNA mismatch repair protein MutS, partial [Clostridiaceae bacterium]|nr:DNA mismatch repair protein MutS [Clostridiaceae bacterium]